MPIVGAKVAARFALQRVLGSGGMGLVFEANDELEDEIVALKWLRRVGHAESLRREFRALAGVRHPNLTEYFGLFCDATSTFLTMERIDGVPLDDFLRSERDRSDYEEVFVATFRQLAFAIGALHEGGIVHCDLKPANVLVERTGRVRVVDFGLARHREATSHGWLGTPAYASPEVVASRRHGPASDWYAFGVMLADALAEAPLSVGSADALSSELWALSRRLLESEPDARPGLAEVFAVLGGSEGHPIRAAGTFVGRREELRVLEAAFDECRACGLRWMNVRGVSGVGKSRLVSELLAILERRSESPWVCWSTAYEREFVPFRALAQFLSALASWARKQGIALLPEQQRLLDVLFARWSPRSSSPSAASSEGETVHERYATPKALGDLIAKLALSQPIVLVLDQLHFGDRDSAELLLGALQHHPSVRMLVIAICRSDGCAESEFFAAMSSRDGRDGFVTQRTLEVGPMSRAEIASLLKSFVPAASTATSTDRIVEQSAGVPWLALELAHSGRGARSPMELIHDRLAEVTDSARRLAEIVAVAGHPLALEAARAALSPVTPSAADVRQLVRERIVRETGTRMLVVDHDLVASAIVARVPKDEERSLHRELASTLSTASPTDHEAVATHFFAAGRPQEAISHAFEAADRAAAMFAFGTEARWLEKILDHGTLDASEELSCRRRLARSLGRAGRGKEAARQYLLVAQRSNVREARRDRCRAVEQLFKAGYRDEATAQLDRLFAEVGVPPSYGRFESTLRLVWERLRLASRGTHISERSGGADEETLLRIDVAAAARAVSLPVELIRGAMFATLGLRLALEHGVFDLACRGLCDEILFSASEGGKKAERRVASLIAQAKHLEKRSRDPELKVLVRMAEGGAILLQGRFGEAAKMLGEAEESLRTGPLGNSWELTFCRTLWMSALRFHGPLTRSKTLVEQWLVDAKRRGDRVAIRNCMNERPMLLLLEDEPSAARIAWHEARQFSGDYDYPEVTALFQRAYIALYEGVGADELARHCSTLRRFFRTVMSRSQGLRVTTRAIVIGIELQIQASRRKSDAPAFARIRRDLRRLSAERTEYAFAFASCLSAAFQHQQGDKGKTLESLSRAREISMACGMRFYSAASKIRYGEVLGGAAGQQSVRQGAEELAALGVKRPPAYVRGLMPGFIEHALELDSRRCWDEGG